MLRELNIASNFFDAAELAHLQEASWPLLENLDIGSCLNVDASASEREAFVAEMAACNMPSLARLGFGFNDLTDPGVIATLICGNWPQLQHLDLFANHFGPLPIRLFGVDHHCILEERLHEFGVKFAGQFAAGRWPLLTTLDLEKGCFDM